MPDERNPAGDSAANPGSTGTGTTSGTQTATGTSTSTPQPGQGAGTGSPGAGTGTGGAATGAGAGAGGNGQPGSTRFEYDEDRSNWIPPHRLQAVSQRARTIEQQLAIERARTRALAGLEPEAPSFEDSLSPEDRELRNGLIKLFPELDLLRKHGEKLAKIAPNADRLLSMGDEQWTREGHRTLRSLSKEYATHIGADTLTPRQQRQLGALFYDWLESDELLAERYAYGDDKLIADFISDLDSNFLAPVRRQGQAGGEETAQRVGQQPRAAAQSTQTQRGQQPPDPHAAPPNEDEVHSRAFAGIRAALTAR